MTITQAPSEAPPEPPASETLTTPSRAPATASRPPSTVSGEQKRNPSSTQGPPRDHLMTTLSLIAIIGGLVVGVIGFASSYSTLANVALTWGFSPKLAQWFPIGVDASILAFLALDLYLIRKDVPWPLLRLAAHAMTGATIWFNASSQGSIEDDPVRAASHGVMPLLFVIGVEAARRLIIKKAQLAAGTATDGIPFHRWVLAPFNTPRFYRQMRLHGLSYPEMLARQQELRGYEQWLARTHGGNLSKASDDERLPLEMAKYGYSVAEALALPEQQDREAEARDQAAEERRRDAQIAAEIAEDKREATRLTSKAELARTRNVAEAAERAAEEEARAVESAEAAEARRAAAEDEQAAAEAERVAVEARDRAAEVARIQAENIARREQAEAETAEARKRAAEARRAIAEAERAAAEAEDVARLSPRERAVRKVARMTLRQGEPALAEIQRELAVSAGTASEYRSEARELVETGYRP